MKKGRRGQTPAKATPSPWQKLDHPNLYRYLPSGTYFAKFRLKGKLISRSLKTDKLTTAKLRLADQIKEERKKLEAGIIKTNEKMTVGEAIQAYRKKGFRPVKPRNKKDTMQLKPRALAYYEQRVKSLLKTWPGIEKRPIARVTEAEVEAWADRVRPQVAGTVFNHTLSVLRHILEFGVRAGARLINPAQGIVRERELAKIVELPDQETFQRFVETIEEANGRFSKACAQLVQFLAFGGFRLEEAANVTWGDVDFKKGHIVLRGHPETGLKNRRPGETRIVPMIPMMRELLEGMRKGRPYEGKDHRVMEVKEAKKAMDRAAEEIGMKRLTHHDLRHLFATRCIEKGVDFRTLAEWMGHLDGGALIMRRYGHVRSQHSVAMAQRVEF